MIKNLTALLISAAVAGSGINPYPTHWWEKISRENAPSWEIFPDEAGPGEVILSKRNELGILSNFAATPFKLCGKDYASMEGFWQSLKYPEGDKDSRINSKVTWPHTRAQVEQMVAFEAKRAGDEASENMKKLGIDYVTFQNRKMIYKAKGESDFYKLIVAAMTAKLDQNKKVQEILKQTGDLKLRPDHHDGDAASLKAWRYYDIWMELRDVRWPDTRTVVGQKVKKERRTFRLPYRCARAQ